ncbi:MAG: small ribosomal subunit Rsm22 family protein [Oceanidesulfovibrio sp.]
MNESITVDTLLPPLPDEAAAYLERYPELLSRAFPLKRKYRLALPDSIKRLSRALTSERGERPADYLRDPALLGAYLYYFLPWNLYRLTRLFTGLREPLLGMLPEESTIVDAGSGPLTTIQALWLALPERRQASWSVNCMDLAGKAMKIGRDLLDDMAGGRAAWKMRLVQKPAPGGVRDLPKRYNLLIAANLLNELATSRDDSPGGAVAGRLGPMLDRAANALLVEPGTRLGGTMISHARETAQERDFVPLAPCPGPSSHAVSGGLFPCAVLSARGRGQAWCHFKAAVTGAPAWLEKLTKDAGFGREDVSLSFVLLGGGEFVPEQDKRMEARVLSNAFSLAEGEAAGDFGAYACSPRGLVLLRAGKRADLPTQGSRVRVEPPSGPERDPKSGAPIAEIGDTR